MHRDNLPHQTANPPHVPPVPPSAPLEGCLAKRALATTQPSLWCGFIPSLASLARGDKMAKMLMDWLRRRPKFSYEIADRDLDLWRCDRCQRIVSQRQMTFHAASKHGFDAPDVRITNGGLDGRNREFGQGVLR